jgi:hypothetical protein
LRIDGLCGNSFGNFSWKSRSYATITVTGAVIAFSTFAGASAGRRRSFASFERMKTNRAGLAFALVGAHFITS